MRPKNHLYLLQWGGDAAPSALSLLRQVSIPVGKGRNTSVLAAEPVSAVHQALGMCCSHGDLGLVSAVTPQTTGGMG